MTKSIQEIPGVAPICKRRAQYGIGRAEIPSAFGAIVGLLLSQTQNKKQV